MKNIIKAACTYSALYFKSYNSIFNPDMTWHFSGNNDLNFNQTLLFADLSFVTQYVGKITGQRSLLQR